MLSSRPALILMNQGRAGGVDSVRIDLLEGRQEKAQRLRPQGERSKATQEPKGI